MTYILCIVAILEELPYLYSCYSWRVAITWWVFIHDELHFLNSHYPLRVTIHEELLFLEYSYVWKFFSFFHFLSFPSFLCSFFQEGNISEFFSRSHSLWLNMLGWQVIKGHINRVTVLFFLSRLCFNLKECIEISLIPWIRLDSILESSPSSIFVLALKILPKFAESRNKIHTHVFIIPNNN